MSVPVDALEDFLRFDEEDDMPLPSKKASQKRPISRPESSQPSKMASIPDDGDLPDMDVDLPLPHESVDWSEAQQHSTLSEDGTEAASRNLLKEYEAEPHVASLPASTAAAKPSTAAALPAREVSLDDEEAMRILEGAEAPEDEINEAELAALLGDVPPTQATQATQTAQATQATLPTPPVFRTDTTENEESLARLLDRLKDRWCSHAPSPLEQVDDSLVQAPQPAAAANPTAAASATLLTGDDSTTLRFFMTEVFEDASVAPGQLFLFGRVPVGSRTESVCVVVGNISRHLFFLPAEREGGRCSVAEVKQEVLDTLSPLVKNTREIGFRVDRKKYAFEIEGIPTEEVVVRGRGYA